MNNTPKLSARDRFMSEAYDMQGALAVLVVADANGQDDMDAISEVAAHAKHLAMWSGMMPKLQDKK